MGKPLIFDLLDDGEYVPERVQRMRYNTCLDCPNYYKPTGQCKLCWCFMSLKTKLKNAYCEEESEEYPNGRWQKVA